ncbi:MAG: L-histidine N(alpha)-methyltransferase [Pedobacter sp.]|nr:L-histidine N(alpha)-methyltransferase [Pedobacter sp.]
MKILDNQDLLDAEIQSTDLSNFLNDVKIGLSQKPKELQSKYFYDKQGDELFQQITLLPEYYLTRCEMDIFSNKTNDIADAIGSEPFDLIELGAGDGTKSIHLLDHLMRNAFEFSYLPIDISGNILSVLEDGIKGKLPEIDMSCLEGDYIEMLSIAVKKSTRRKVVLLLGGNIGNMEVKAAEEFCKLLYKHLHTGDKLIIGFDLKKHPQVILNAYNDSQGVTSAFNLNLLSRINIELDANFYLNAFEHYQCYDPKTGECRSHLVSLKKQSVLLDGEHFEFEKDECIFMEVSRKFSLKETEELALKAGFSPGQHILDPKGWFSDSVWLVS